MTNIMWNNNRFWYFFSCHWRG